MKSLLLSFFLFGAALSAPQLFGLEDSFDLQSSLGGYLPPRPSGPSGTCEPRTRTIFSTRVVTSTQLTTVYREDNRVETRTEYDTRVVPTTVFSQIVSTRVVPSVVFSTRVNYRTQFNTRTNYVTVPGETRVVTVTQNQDRPSVQVQTRFVTSVQRVPTTVYRDVVSTRVVSRPVVNTVFRTQFVTRTERLPGQTRVRTDVRYSTIFSTQVIPGPTVLLTQTVFRTQVGYSTVYARPQTRVITSTQIQPVYTTIFSQRVDYRTNTRAITQTRFDQRVSTVFSTRVVPQYNTRTVNVDRNVVRTVTSTQNVRSTFYSTFVSSRVNTVPGQTRFVTVTNTRYETQRIPGQTRTVVNTRTVINTNYVTSTRYNTRANTVTVTRTNRRECKTGYNYDPPAVQFNF